ncbi:hypothetical protein ACU6VI_00695 [Sphaerotilus natans]|uniref:hypothetical protein n=1 Tax=Sphaerotilus natans TaxID=34103 RepID=UPI00406D2E25
MAWQDVRTHWLPQAERFGHRWAQALTTVDQAVHRTQSSLLMLQGKSFATAWGLARAWSASSPLQAVRVWHQGVEETMSHHRQLQAVLARGQRDLARAAEQLIADLPAPALPTTAPLLRTTAASWSATREQPARLPPPQPAASSGCTLTQVDVLV